MDLYIANLHRTVTPDEIEELLEPYGKVLDVKIIVGKKKKSKGYGFVSMEDQQAGEEAIKALENRLIRGLNLVIKEARKK